MTTRHDALAPIRDALNRAVYHAIRRQIDAVAPHVPRALVVQVLARIAAEQAAIIAHDAREA